MRVFDEILCEFEGFAEFRFRKPRIDNYNSQKPRLNRQKLAYLAKTDSNFQKPIEIVKI